MEDAKTLALQITRVSQRAERSLYASGCALELTKCAWFALTWQWDPKGKVHLLPTARTQAEAKLTSGGNLTEMIKIPILEPSEATRTFGCYSAHNGSSEAQVKILFKRQRMSGRL